MKLPGIDFPVPFNADGTVAWPEPDPSSPFYVTGPALISFSGGRTSAFMLFQILWAHGGTLPDDVIVVFANTGKEDEKTLRFAHECASRWQVRIHWVEYRDDEAGFDEVGFNSASRQGEPFEALISKKGFVPNRGAPYCSIELKARTIRDFIRAVFGWKNWTSIIGIRSDERERVMGAIGRNESGKDPWRNALPLDRAKVTKNKVMTFWLGRRWRVAILLKLVVSLLLPLGFDLGMLEHEGNCDLCWKKSRGKRMWIVRHRPETARWWHEQETRPDRQESGGSLFREDESVAALVHAVRTSPTLPILEDYGDPDEECGFDTGCFIGDADQLDARAA